VSAFNFVGSTATAATVVANDAIGDTFTLKAGLGTVSGGTGKNTYNLVAATTSTPATKYVNITNFQVENSSGKVDTLLLSGHAARLESSYLTSAAGLTGWSVSHGVASKSTATLNEFILAIGTTISDGGLTPPVGYDVYVASIGSNVYVADLNASGTAIAHMVQLTGLASSSGLGAEIGVATTTGYIEIQ
jgi:hypothetical protein